MVRKFLFLASRFFLVMLVLTLCVMATTSPTVAAPEAVVTDYDGITACPTDGLGSNYEPSFVVVSRNSADVNLSGSAYLVQLDSLYFSGAVLAFPVTQGGVFFGQHLTTASSDNVSADFAAYCLALINIEVNGPGAIEEPIAVWPLNPDVTVVDYALVAGISRGSLSHEFIAYSSYVLTPCPIFNGQAGLISPTSAPALIVLSV